MHYDVYYNMHMSSNTTKIWFSEATDPFSFGPLILKSEAIIDVYFESH